MKLRCHQAIDLLCLPANERDYDISDSKANKIKCDFPNLSILHIAGQRRVVIAIIITLNILAHISKPWMHE